jgi:hypothetical protein
MSEAWTTLLPLLFEKGNQPFKLSLLPPPTPTPTLALCEGAIRGRVSFVLIKKLPDPCIEQPSSLCPPMEGFRPEEARVGPPPGGGGSPSPQAKDKNKN